MQRQLERLGPPPFDAADRKYAAEIQATLTAEDIASAYARAGVPVRRTRRCAISSCPTAPRARR